MKKVSLSILLIISTLSIKAQDLKSITSTVKGLVKEVKLEKSTMGQKLESSEQNPTEFTLTTSETDSKGKTEAKVYSFNLVFFDISKVERKAEKKQMLMTLQTADGIDAIAVSKNGQPDGYTDKFSIVVDNADEARDLEKALRELIPAGKSKWESMLSLPTDYAGLMNFVQSKIKDFTAMGVTMVQKASTTTDYKYRTKISTQRSDGKKSEQKDYNFAWGDLTESSLKVSIKGNSVGVEAQTVDKIKYVNITDSKTSENDSEVLIATASPIEAKILAVALQKLIPLARKDQQEYLTKNTPKTLDALKLVADFQVGAMQYNQSIPPACLCQYTRKGVEKGKSIEEKLVFNLGDLTDFKLKVEKELVTITANTVNKLPFVEFTEKNERKFEKNMAFYVPDIEKSRLLLAQLPALANTCKESVKPENFDWLADKLKNAGVDGINQKLEYMDPSNRAKWRLTVSETGGKKMKEDVFEFNVYDVDVLKADYKVEKQNLAVRVKTKNNEKLIKQITDGSPTFTSEILYLTTNAEDAKKINATIHGIGSNYKLLTDGKFVTNAIVFDANSTNIRPESDEVIRTMGEILKNNASMKLKITGFTDADGDDKKNLDLSKRRATAVKDKLVKDYGIDAARLTADGKGEADPIAPNTTPEGKAQNRRVEFEKI